MKFSLVILIAAICGLGVLLALGSLGPGDDDLYVQEYETPLRRRSDPPLPVTLVDENEDGRIVLGAKAIDWKPRTENDSERSRHVEKTKRLVKFTVEEPVEEEEPDYVGQVLLDEDGNELIDGPWVLYHSNGEIDEQGAYAMGKEIGRWDWWYESGEKKAVGQFENGDRVGRWTWWHENGEILMQGAYEGGVGSGRWVMYHDNGRRWGEGDYVNGEISGHWQFWLPDGSVDHERSGHYANGELVE